MQRPSPLSSDFRFRIALTTKFRFFQQLERKGALNLSVNASAKIRLNGSRIHETMPAA
jgi:hypothetical protein